MNVNEFGRLPWSKSKAYMLGLMLPRLDIAVLENMEDYVIAGTVAHQPKSVSETQLMDHVFSLTELLGEDNLSFSFPLIFSENIKYLKSNGTLRKNGKRGFAIYLETNISCSGKREYLELYNELNNQLIDIVSQIPNQFINNFISGTIDGHSSLDTTRHLIATDIDRDEKKQGVLQLIIDKSIVEAEINARGGRSDSSKADQLRYSKKSLEKLVGIGLLSTKRLKDIQSVVR